MLAQPTFVYPNIEAIDVNRIDGNTFRLQINSDKLVAYQIDILSMNNVNVYSTGKVTTDSQLPIYRNKGEESYLFVNIPSGVGLTNGADYKWHFTQWEEINATYPTPSVWVTYGKIYKPSSLTSTTTTVYLRPHVNVSNGMYIKINGEVRRIGSYSLNNPSTPLYGIATLQSPLSIAPAQNTDYTIWKDNLDNNEYGFPFYARSIPSIEFNNFGTLIDNKIVINSSEQIITATYTQNENVPLQHYKFELYDSSNKLIDSTQETHCLDIKYKYEKFLNDETYTLKLFIKNQMNIDISKTITFKVEYATATVAIAPIASVDYQNCCPIIDYSKVISILGKTSGVENNGYSYTDSGLHLDKNYSIYWDEISGVGDLKISEEFTIIFKIRLDEGFIRNPIEITNDETGKTYTVRYDGINFYYKIGNSPEVSYFPYSNIKTTSLEGETVGYNTIYIWDDSGFWDDGNIWLDNDIANRFYWYIICLPNQIRFVKGEVVID